MLSRIHQSKKKGFTIIEVLIVLAIAGLILLVVFLAVPALQRNARNTQRGSDVSNILGAISEFSNSNNGATPTTAAVNTTTGVVTITGAAGTNSSQANLGYYKSATNSVAISVVTLTSDTNTTNEDNVIVFVGGICNSAGTMANDGPSRSIAATYTNENGTTAGAKQCKAS